MRLLLHSFMALLAIIALALPIRAADQPAPILQKCVHCHNGDKLAGGLDLTARKSALVGGDSGPALVPGDAAKSLMFKQVSLRKMPPKEPLADADIEVVRKWIADGAGLPEKLAGAHAERAGRAWWSRRP